MDFFHVLDKPMFQLLSAELVIPEAISSLSIYLKYLQKTIEVALGYFIYLFGEQRRVR